MKWNIKDWHANYYYNITAILQQQARVPISSVPILNFFQLICRIEIHRTLISCNLQKCALEQVQVADEQLGRSETKHFYRLQGRRVRLFCRLTNQDFFLYAIPRPYAINIITNLIIVPVLNNVPACICKTHKTTQRIIKSIV